MKRDGRYDFNGIVPITTNILINHGLNSNLGIQKVADIYIYPNDYFNPYDYINGKLYITKNSRSIHWYTASWLDGMEMIKFKLGGMLRRILKVMKFFR